MSDDKTKRGAPDRREVAGSEAYEVSYLATKHGIAPSVVRGLIAKHGNSRAKLEAAIKALKGGK